MLKNRALMVAVILALFLTPIIIVLADAHNKSITNNITFSASTALSDQATKRLNVTLATDAAASLQGIINAVFTLGITVGQSIQLKNTENISLTCYAANAAGFEKNITVTSSPGTGSGFVVYDGGAVSTPHTENETIGSYHTIEAIDTKDIVALESRYHFSNWSDAGLISHTIQVGVVDANYTATFNTEYYLEVTAGSGSGWYVSGVNASSSAPYIKNQINGQSRSSLVSYTLDGSPTPIARATVGNYTLDVTMSAHHDLTWNYITQYYVGVSSATTGLTVLGADWYDTGDTATIQATTPQTQGGISYTFNHWARTIAGGAQVNSTSNPYSYTANDYATFEAFWDTLGVYLDILGNATITLDGAPVTTPDTVHFTDGTNHTLTAIYLGGALATLNILGNATITFNNVPVITPDTFDLAAGLTYTVEAIAPFVPGGLGGSSAAYLLLALIICIPLAIVLFNRRK